MKNDLEKKIKRKRQKKIAVSILAVALLLICVLQLRFQTVTGALEAMKGSIGGDNIKVTLEISCEPLSDNMSKLKNEDKEVYVPSDGMILKEKKYTMEKGSTAFDLLKKATVEEGIQTEYSYDKVYDTYFIEGINNLYMKDAGGMSGWLYYVNGKSPSYGVSDYKLQNKDKIIFIYSCNGGGDVKLNSK